MSTGGISPSRSLSEDEMGVYETLHTKFNHAEIIHLNDILSGAQRDLGRYYGDNPADAGTKKEMAKEVVRNHCKAVNEFLHKLDNDFSTSTTKKNELEQNLVDRGIPGGLVDEVEPTQRQLLLFAYHLLYNQDGFEEQLRLLELNSRLFKETSERTYKYDSDEVNVENIESEIERYVRKRNAELYRPFTIRCQVSEDRIYLDFYRETARVMQNVFKQRKDDVDPSQIDTPTVTHESAYRIKTLLVRIDTSADDVIKFVYKSNPKNGWKNELEEFFDWMFSIEDPFDESKQEVDEGASEVIEAVKEVADDDDASGEDVEQAVTETIEGLAADSSEDDDVPAIADADVQWVGIVIEDDDNTLTEHEDLTTKSGMVEYTKNTPGAEDRLLHLIRATDDENFGLKLRSEFGDGGSEEFIVYKDNWSEDSRVDEEAREALNSILRED